MNTVSLYHEGHLKQALAYVNFITDGTISKESKEDKVGNVLCKLAKTATTVKLNLTKAQSTTWKAYEVPKAPKAEKTMSGIATSIKASLDKQADLFQGIEGYSQAINGLAKLILACSKLEEGDTSK